MFLKDNNPDRSAKGAARQLDKLCAKMEQLCVPVQDALMRIASGQDSSEARQRIEQFQEKLSIVNGALYLLNERQCAPGGGMSQRLAARIASQSKIDRGAMPTANATGDGEVAPTVQGSCSFLSLAALLHLLAEQKKSGKLTLQLKEESVTLAVHAGDVVYVSCTPSRRGERLGELLVDNGAVAREHLMSFVDGYRSRGDHFGMALVERGVVSKEAMDEALMQQVQQRLDRAFAEPDCTFTFCAGNEQAPTGLAIGIEDFLESTGRATTTRKDNEELSPTFGDSPAGLDAAPSVAARKWQGGVGDSWGWKDHK